MTETSATGRSRRTRTRCGRRHRSGWRTASPRRCSCCRAQADRICPIDDNWQLFVALRERGHDVELVLYPEEHHVMMATARPDRRIDRMERVVSFLERHCPPY